MLFQGAGRVDPSVKPITPENPIPRRVFAVPIEHPVGHDELTAVTQTLVRLDGSGIPIVVRPMASGIALARTTAAGQAEPNPQAAKLVSLEAFHKAAADAIAQWRYEPPAEAPIEFVVMVRFHPGQPVSVSQTERSGPVFAGPDGVRVGGDAELQLMLERDRATLARAAANLDQARAVAAQANVAAAGTAGSSGPVRVGGAIKAPIKTRDVRPVYPEIAQSARVQGVVILETTIDEQGRVSDARILRSIPLLDQAASDAVRQWEFTPTLLNGAPVSVIMTVTVQFSLPPQ